MKLRNKKTGEIIDTLNSYDCTKGISFGADHHDGDPTIESYDSLAELNEEWEDYEEPKEHWCVTMYGGITRIKDGEEPIDDLIEIGNYFNSKEDAYDAVEKLKAWKRLKDKGFSLSAVVDTFFCLDVFMKGESYEAIKDDLKIVFGGEE